MIPIVEASGHITEAQDFVGKLNSAILFPLMMFMLSLATMLFVWGGFKYLYKADDASARAEGQRHMLYGLIGIVVMVTAYALLMVVVNTFFDVPSGCDPAEDASCMNIGLD